MSLPPYPAAFYVALHKGNVGDVEYYRRACAGAKSVLELGCGDARVLAELALNAADGRFVGIEFDEGLLNLAQARALSSEVLRERMELRRGDMREPIEGSYERIIIPHGGLYCLLDEADLQTTLNRCREGLAPGGELIFDLWAADDFHAEHDPEEQESWWTDHLGAFAIEGKDYECVERSEWNRDAQRLNVLYSYVEVGTENSVEGHLRQRYLLVGQVRDALEKAGFSTIAIRGGFEGQAYSKDSDLMVVCASA